MSADNGAPDLNAQRRSHLIAASAAIAVLYLERVFIRRARVLFSYALETMSSRDTHPHPRVVARHCDRIAPRGIVYTAIRFRRCRAKCRSCRPRDELRGHAPRTRGEPARSSAGAKGADGLEDGGIEATGRNPVSAACSGSIEGLPSRSRLFGSGGSARALACAARQSLRSSSSSSSSRAIWASENGQLGTVARKKKIPVQILNADDSQIEKVLLVRVVPTAAASQHGWPQVMGVNSRA